MTYLKVVWRVRVQKIQEMAPKISVSSMTPPSWIMVWKVYRGDVPISP
jgi:hypothetical protein